ncbi:nucleotide disphospho-sugar-binding domain-containing protein [Kitasatospora sp. NPDC051984]|uniref:nucleotide disphospho-sugar-binding domain-containing protein n=1 Tax=Kitasatospora sp. NPDC051984 TaxID=3364059 RepID=UPI0037CA55E5
MRVLFATWAEPGHLYSLVQLAWACQAAGHEVRFATPPASAPAVARAGLIGVAVGQDVAVAQIRNRVDLAPWRSFGRWPESWAARPELLDDGHRTVLAALADKQLTVADAMADDLIAFARAWRPDVVVHDSLTFAGPLTAAVLGVPALGHTWGTATVIRIETDRLDGELRPGYRDLFERHGADPERGPIGWFDPCPPSLRLPDPAPRRRIPVRYVPYNGPGLLPDWLHTDSGRPRVCVTAGVSGGKVSPDRLPDVLTGALAALTALDVEVVLAVGAGQAGKLGGLPDGVRVAESLPMTALLPTCAAVVHHGGSGTGLTAAAHGIPQLVLPQVPISAEIGERLAHAGAGLLPAPGEQHDPAVIGASVAALLDDPRYGKAAAALREEMLAEPTPAERVAVLVDAVA